MLGKDKATVFYQALELLHSADSESEKKLHGLLTEASNNFELTRKQQAARSTSSSALKPNPNLPVQPKSLLATNEVITEAEDNTNNNASNNNNKLLRTPPPKPPQSHLGGSPQPNPPKKRTTQLI